MSRKGENIFKRKDGRWEARYIHHYENGKAKYRYIYGSSYTEAKNKRLAELRSSEAEWKFGSKCTFRFKTLAYLWLQNIRSSVKESTFTRYYRTVTKKIIPYMGQLEISKVDAAFINQMICTMSREGGVGNMPLSPKTVSDIIGVFKSIWSYGCMNGFPCRELSGIKLPQKTTRTARILPDDTVKRITEMLSEPGDTTCLGLVFTLFTGVRIGELCGLKWEDVDLNSGTVIIRRTVERIANLNLGADAKTKVIIQDPKTRNSIRTIPIPRFLCNYMKRFQCENDCFLITGKQQFIEPHGFYTKYKRFLKKNDLENCTFHALRHTFATKCIESGFDEKSLSEILGHSSVTTTMSLYVHPTLQMKRTQMERLTPEGYSQSE